jgi:hypothetical protein
MAQSSLSLRLMKRVDLMRQQIRNIELLEDTAFRRLRWDVVSHYRRNEADQERIAVELVDKSVSSSPRARQRVNEILSMLDHVHDPFISGM